MRSSMKKGLVGRCPRCFIRAEHCICADIPRIANQIEIVIVRHQWEQRKSTGTARIAELALERCRCLQIGYDPAPVDQQLAALTDAWLLFPDGGRAVLPTTRPGRLVVLDGTWAQVVRMRRRLGALAELPRFSLPPKPVPPLRLRRSARPEDRSTLEAIADALALLEGDATSGPLSLLHDRYVHRVLRARGALPRRATPP